MKKVLVIALLLVGCATPQKRAIKMTNKYGPTCEALGYQKDSDDYRNCVTSMYMSDRQRAVAIYGATQRKPLNCTTLGTNTTCY